MEGNMIQGANPLVDEVRGLITKEGDGKLKAPKTIIQTASNARALYSIVRSQNLKRIAQYAALEGLIAGNPPYDQGELEVHGLAFMTNYNDLSALSRFEKEGLSYWNLTHQADRLVKFELDMDSPEAADWADILSIEGDKVLRRWKSFSTMMGTHTAQLSKFGLSVLIWPDEQDWRPRVTELHRFLVPDQTLADLDQLTFCFFENDFTAQYLWDVYDTLKDKWEKGDDDYKYFWNKEALEELLLNRANSIVKAPNQQFVDFYDLQQKMQNGDYTLQQLYGDGIRLISLLYKEYSGKWSHYMFDTVYAVTNKFLFNCHEQYHDFSQACAIFTVSPSEFTLHSNKGIAHKIFAPCQAKNQLACSLVDMARMASTPMLRNQNAGSTRDPQQIKLFPGVPTDIGNAEFVDNRFGNNIQQVVGALNYLEQNLSVNLGMSGDDPSIPDQDQGSKSETQVYFQSFRESGIRKNKTAHFYTQMDFVYRNIFSIMLRSKRGYGGFELADKWKQACIKKGVPESIFDTKGVEWGLPDHMDVTATRVAGDGSTAGQMMALASLEPILPMMGPREQTAYKRERILAATGPEGLPRYMQDTDIPDEVAGGASLAGVENMGMQQGFAPIFSLANNHETHFAVHMSMNVNVMQQVQQQQITPIDAQKVFDQSVPHTEEHWKAIAAKAPFGEQFIDKWREPYEQFIQYATLNRKNAIKMYQAEVEKQQKLQEQEAQANSEIAIKNKIADADIARKNRESEYKEARQQAESQVRGEIKRRQVDQDAEIKRTKVALDHGVNVQKAADERSLEESRQELAALTTVETPNELI